MFFSFSFHLIFNLISAIPYVDPFFHLSLLGFSFSSFSISLFFITSFTFLSTSSLVTMSAQLVFYVVFFFNFPGWLYEPLMFSPVFRSCMTSSLSMFFCHFVSSVLFSFSILIFLLSVFTPLITYSFSMLPSFFPCLTCKHVIHFIKLTGILSHVRKYQCSKVNDFLLELPLMCLYYAFVLLWRLVWYHCWYISHFIDSSLDFNMFSYHPQEHDWLSILSVDPFKLTLGFDADWHKDFLFPPSFLLFLGSCSDHIFLLSGWHHFLEVHCCFLSWL